MPAVADIARDSEVPSEDASRIAQLLSISKDLALRSVAVVSTYQMVRSALLSFSETVKASQNIVPGTAEQQGSSVQNP